MQMTQPLHIAAETTPTKLATVFNDRSRTWAETRDRVARLAGALRNLGVDTGDRVAILGANSDRYLEYYFATWWCGGVVVPMNVRWSAEENGYSLNDSGAKVLFVDDLFGAHVPGIQKETDHALTLIHLDDTDCPEGWLDYETLIAESDPIEDVFRSGEDLAGIYYTGGTTGFPKGAMIPHRSLWSNGVFLAKHMFVESGDSYLHCAPMFHLADGAGSNGATMAGATHYFIPMFAPAAAIEAVAKYRPTHALWVPTMVQMILDDPSFEPSKFTSLKHVLYGASPMPEGLLLRALKELSSIGWIQGYGQTEMGPIISTLAPKYHTVEGEFAGKLRSAGRPTVGTWVRIVDEDFKEVPRGSVGEIAVSGPHTMQGYWNLDEQTEAALRDGWVLTGDGAYMDEDGFIFIVDRVKDMIITGGENVFSAEVESVISTMNGVAGVAVVGIPSEKWGEAVHAIIIPTGKVELTEEAVIAYCRDHIANYKLPRSAEFRSEPFPLSGAGKVLKKDLRAPFWEGQERGVH